MVKLLLDAGADPMLNTFDGAIMTQGVVYGNEAPVFLPGFPGLDDPEDARPLPGFPGLFALLQLTTHTGHLLGDWVDHYDIPALVSSN